LSNVIAAATAAGNPAMARAVADGSVTRSSFQSLFNDGRTGPVSHVVRDLWTSRPRVAAALSGVDAPPPTLASASGTVSAGAVQPLTPAERVRNIFNDLMSSLRT
jgi:hypothetical protein